MGIRARARGRAPVCDPGQERSPHSVPRAPPHSGGCRSRAGIVPLRGRLAEVVQVRPGAPLGLERARESARGSRARSTRRARRPPRRAPARRRWSSAELPVLAAFRRRAPACGDQTTCMIWSDQTAVGTLTNAAKSAIPSAPAEPRRARQPIGAMPFGCSARLVCPCQVEARRPSNRTAPLTLGRAYPIILSQEFESSETRRSSRLAASRLPRRRSATPRGSKAARRARRASPRRASGALRRGPRVGRARARERCRERAAPGDATPRGTCSSAGGKRVRPAVAPAQRRVLRRVPATRRASSRSSPSSCTRRRCCTTT